MTSNKNKKNKKRNIIILIIICFFVFILFLLLQRIQTYKSFRKQIVDRDNITNVNDGSTSLVTPMITIGSNTSKSMFIHPQGEFTFEYPTGWYLELMKRNVSDPWYEVYLADQEKNPNFRINFITGGRDYPHYREETEYKMLGGKQIKWTTLYDSNNQAVEAFTGFPNNDFGDKLTGLYIYLPKDSQEEFISQVEDIIASLK